MIEIKITGYTLQECIDQINGKVTIPVAAPIVGEEVMTTEFAKAAEPVKVAEPVKAEESVKEEKPAPVAKAEEPAKAAEPVKEEKPAETKAEEKTPAITRDDCFTICTKVKNEKKIGALRLILAEFGANKFSEVKEADYPALYEACEKRLAQED